MNDEYILKIKAKLSKFNDPELTELVMRLIDERNYLADTINIDLLTGVYNRRILNHVRDYSVVVFCDVDYFKQVNDTFGHDVGDMVLKNVSKILLNSCRTNDLVCRYGGDEFLIIYQGCSLDVVEKRMQDVQMKVHDNIKLPNFNLTLSIGIAPNVAGNTLDDTLKCADIAVYESKENGRNMISVYGNHGNTLKRKK